MHNYFAELYQDTMFRIYQEAIERIAKCLPPEGHCLDCGAGSVHQFQTLQKKTPTPKKLRRHRMGC